MAEVRVRYRRYVWFLGLLILLAFSLPMVSFQSNVHVHTILEVAATMMAAVVGSLALVRFYSKKSNRFLFIGIGFIATAFLDGYHGFVTSHWFYRHFPADLPKLAPWSWLVSRLFLSILLWLSVVVHQNREKPLNQRGELSVYLIVSLLAIACFIFFTQDPLPQAYLQDWIFNRPMEFVPAIFFLLALSRLYRKADWRTDAFNRWVLLALIVSFFIQTLFMPFSNGLHDIFFDVAHFLKIVSYILVFIGLASSMSELVQQVEEGSHSLRQVNRELQNEIEERKEIEAQLAETQQRLTDSREEERLHLARELHDGPLQDLAGTRFQLQALKVDLSGSLVQFQTVQDNLYLVMESLRRTCYELRPPTLAPFGLEVAIRAYVKPFIIAHPKIEVQLELDEDQPPLPERFSLALYRIYQHALTNVDRHAEANNIRVQFKLTNHQVLLKIVDDGCGFVVPDNFLKLARQGHLGLLGSKERASSIGGELQVKSAPDEGTTILVIAPRPRSEVTKNNRKS